MKIRRRKQREHDQAELQAAMTPEEALLSRSYAVLRRVPRLIGTLIALVLMLLVTQVVSQIQLQRRNDTLDNIERIVKLFESMATSEPDSDRPRGEEFNLLVLEGLRKIDLMCQQIDCDGEETP